MNKLRANSLLIACVFGITLLMLCTFGTDAAYIILSRYKLQKITEELAYEYASTKARNYQYAIGSEDTEALKNMVKRYTNIYNVFGSGVMVFNIESLEYKAHRLIHEGKKYGDVVVKVKTTSKVMPAFLRHLGVKEIYIHSTAYAQTNRIKMAKEIKGNDTFSAMSVINKMSWMDTDSSNLEKIMAVFPKSDNSDGSMTEFKDDIDDMFKAEYIIAKNMINGDFAVKFEYKNVDEDGNEDTSSTLEKGGGFFIEAGYDYIDEDGNPAIRWADIGNRVTNVNNNYAPKRMCVQPKDTNNSWDMYEEETSADTSTQCFYCMSAAPYPNHTIVFKLNEQTPGSKNTGGYINRISKIRIYKAGGAANSIGSSGGITEYEDPCKANYSEAVTTTVVKEEKVEASKEEANLEEATELREGEGEGVATNPEEEANPEGTTEPEEGEINPVGEGEVGGIPIESSPMQRYSSFYAERILKSAKTAPEKAIESIYVSAARKKKTVTKINSDFYSYFNRNAVIELTILNNVSIVKPSYYNRFTPLNETGEDAESNTIQGSESIEELLR